MTTRIERMICLALTVLGPLAIERASQNSHGESPSKKSLKGLLGKTIHNFFCTVEWSTVKTLSSLFLTTETCLQWFGMEFPNQIEEDSNLSIGFQSLTEWNAESKKLNNDIIQLSSDLAITQKRCEELSQEVDVLRKKCTSYSEAGSILEQDRQQLQSLLSDKCKLIKENQTLERRICSLNELLQYATSQNVLPQMDSVPEFSWIDTLPITVTSNRGIGGSSGDDVNEDETVIDYSPSSQTAGISPDFDLLYSTN